MVPGRRRGHNPADWLAVGAVSSFANSLVTMEALYTQDAAGLDDLQLLTLRDQAIAQQRWARQYALQLIRTVPESLWYVTPAGFATHVAWQVGHLAVAQYGLMLFRQRGRAEGDAQLMPGWLRKQFGRGSQPSPTGQNMPEPGELMERLEAIDHQARTEAAQLTASTLREPCDIPYCVYPTKLGALLLAPIHESIHAGQIGLLRRGHGLDPVR